MRIHYGKAEVSVYKSDGVGELWGAEVELDVFGDNFAPAYTAGDNSMVIATDTMKNFVHAAALDFGGRFLETYEHVERIAVRVGEVPFARRGPALFQRLHDDRAIVELSLNREGVLEHRCGREGIQLVKITGSSFASFARDSYTTLPEVRDRPLFVHLDLHWRYADWSRRVRSEDVRDSIAATFSDFVSMSIQHLVHEMGTRALRQFPELDEISFEAQNRLWDTARVSEADERVKIFTEPRPPYGMIGLELRRADLS
jgi:urate oxidase / 2-oxo-4-hydroxy-4-carboxy-5-ureidoimidazoline decarboxylase